MFEPLLLNPAHVWQVEPLQVCGNSHLEGAGVHLGLIRSHNLDL